MRTIKLTEETRQRPSGEITEEKPGNCYGEYEGTGDRRLSTRVRAGGDQGAVRTTPERFDRAKITVRRTSVSD